MMHLLTESLHRAGGCEFIWEDGSPKSSLGPTPGLQTESNVPTQLRRESYHSMLVSWE